MKIADYEIQEEISRGKHISIYRAKKDKISYVLKVVEKKAARTRKEINSVQKEYDLLRRIDSEYVIKALDFIDNNDYAAIVMEDINAPSLKIIDFNIASPFDIRVSYTGSPEKLEGTPA